MSRTRGTRETSEGTAPGTIPSGAIPSGTIPSGTIVVGVDGSFNADQAVVWAAEEAQARHRPLTLVHVERTIGAQERGWLAQAGIPLDQVGREIRADSEELLHKARARASAAAPSVEVDAVRYTGDTDKILLDLAERAELVVLGSRGRGPVSSLLLGSVSVAVSRQATCAVVVVRPREDVARLRGVLVATAGTPHSATALETAFREASCRGLALTVAYCHPKSLSASGGWRAADPADHFYGSARARVDEATARWKDKFPDVDVAVELFAGHVDDCIADLSREHQLTVIGRHAKTLHERVGSAAHTTAIVEHACGAVLIVP